MIQIKIKCSDSQIKEMSVKGHAGYDEAGKDLVCAGVSSIMFGLLNALDEMSENAVEISVHDRIEIRTDSMDPILQTILKTGMIQLKTVEESYPDFIKIKIQEV